MTSAGTTMGAGRSVGLGIGGCGFVADYYLATKHAYPELEIRGVHDVDGARRDAFCAHHDLRAVPSLEALLDDPAVDVILNLTNPRAHFEITRRCLEAGKHVYSEKPFAMDLGEAETLVALAEEKGLLLSSAPCSALGKTARTLSHAVKRELCGAVRLVYAELDDGFLPAMAYRKWVSESGAPWPYRDEFEVGCTLEHAGYVVTWLVEMFGAVESVTAFSTCVIPDKVPGEPPLDPPDTADVSFGVLHFESGVVARLSTTIVAPHDHAVRVFGDEGVLEVDECWDNDTRVTYRPRLRIRRKTLLSPLPLPVRLPYPMKVVPMERGNTRMDFLLGVQAMADALLRDKALLLSSRFCLHVNEVALALQYAGPRAGTYVTRTRPS